MHGAAAQWLEEFIKKNVKVVGILHSIRQENDLYDGKCPDNIPLNGMPLWCVKQFKCLGLRDWKNLVTT